MIAPPKNRPLASKTGHPVFSLLPDAPSRPAKKKGEWTFIGRHLELWEAEGWMPEIASYREFSDFFHLATLLADPRELETLRGRCLFIGDFLPKKQSAPPRGIRDVLPPAKNFLELEGKELDLEISRMEQEMRNISRRFSKMELLWEKVHDALLKIPSEEDRLHAVKAQLDEKKEGRGQFVRDVEEARNGLSPLRDRSQEVDCMLPLLPEYPLSLALCKDLIHKNREDLLAGQKNIRRLWEKHGSLQEAAKNHIRKYEIHLNLLSGLHADQSFYLEALTKLLHLNEARLRLLRETSVKILLRLAKTQIFLDHFPAPGRESLSKVGLRRHAMGEMENALRRGTETLKKWKGSVQDLGAEDPLHVSVKTQTLMDVVRKDFCSLPSPPDMEGITALVKRNYVQEEEVHAFELDHLARIISEKDPAAFQEGEKDAGAFSSLAMRLPLRKRVGPKGWGIFRALKKRRKAARARKMEYPETRRGLYKIVFLLAAVAALGYGLQDPSRKVDARAPDAEKILDVFPLPAGSEVHAQTYGAAKIKTTLEASGDRREKWEVFLPLFENFSVHWSQENRPMLINKSGKVPGSRSLETLGLFKEIEQRVDAEPFGFFSRLFMDFTELGVSPREALHFVLLNEKWTASQQPPTVKRVRYMGKNRPIPQLEGRDFKSFVEAIAPYITEQYSLYSRKLGIPPPPNVAAYSRTLAEDIYFSSRAFGVPLTSMVSIAHQETFFMNIFGDSLKSVGPFQLYEPTRPLIVKDMREAGLKLPGRVERLEDHITLSTYMAVFHFSTLMRRNTSPGGPSEQVVDLDKSMKLYNGSPIYPLRVFQKNLQLKQYLETTKPS